MHNQRINADCARNIRIASVGMRVQNQVAGDDFDTQAEDISVFGFHVVGRAVDDAGVLFQRQASLGSRYKQVDAARNEAGVSAEVVNHDLSACGNIQQLRRRADGAGRSHEEVDTAARFQVEQSAVAIEQAARGIIHGKYDVAKRCFDVANVIDDPGCQHKVHGLRVRVGGFHAPVRINLRTVRQLNHRAVEFADTVVLVTNVDPLQNGSNRAVGNRVSNRLNLLGNGADDRNAVLAEHVYRARSECGLRGRACRFPAVVVIVEVPRSVGCNNVRQALQIDIFCGGHRHGKIRVFNCLVQVINRFERTAGDIGQVCRRAGVDQVSADEQEAVLIVIGIHAVRHGIQPGKRFRTGEIVHRKQRANVDERVSAQPVDVAVHIGVILACSHLVNEAQRIGFCAVIGVLAVGFRGRGNKEGPANRDPAGVVCVQPGNGIRASNRQRRDVRHLVCIHQRVARGIEAVNIPACVRIFGIQGIDAVNKFQRICQRLFNRRKVSLCTIEHVNAVRRLNDIVNQILQHVGNDDEISFQRVFFTNVLIQRAGFLFKQPAFGVKIQISQISGDRDGGQTAAAR